MDADTSPVTKVDIIISYSDLEGNKQTQTIDVGSTSSISWAASINYGYVIKLDINDTQISELQENTNIIQDYLKYGKINPFYLKMRLTYERFDKKELNSTPVIWSVIDSITSFYVDKSGSFTITAVDPVTWFLKRNILGGRAYKGKFKSFLEWLIIESNKKLGNALTDNKKLQLNMDDTIDEHYCTWYTFRKSPIDIIRDNLNLGVLFSTSRTPYILTVDTGDGNTFNIYIKDQKQLFDEANRIYKNEDIFKIGAAISQGIDMTDMPYFSIYDAWQGYSQKRLLCKYISSSTGDEIKDKNIVEVDSVNILSVQTKPNEAFKRPQINQGDYILPLPEIYDGSWGKYKSYINSTTKELYSYLAQSTMKLQLQLYGTPYISKTQYLGSYVIKLDFPSYDGNYYLNGLWIVYGFEHSVVKSKMNTKLLMYRLDHDFKTSYEVKVKR